VRVPKELVVFAYGREMMNETNHPSGDNRGQRPPARCSRNDQMAARRDFQIG